MWGDKFVLISFSLIPESKDNSTLVNETTLSDKELDDSMLIFKDTKIFIYI